MQTAFSEIDISTSFFKIIDEITADRFQTQMIKDALSAGAYIAGGFAERYLAYIVLNHSVKELQSYLFELFGDIDIWFENAADREKFIAEQKEKTENLQNIVSVETQFANSFVFKAENGLTGKLQIILVENLSPEKNLERFDFVNSICYIDSNQILYYKPEILSLIKNGELHFDIVKDNVICALKRISKWLSKKSYYTKITNSTKELLYIELESLLQNKRSKFRVSKWIFYKFLNILTKHPLLTFYFLVLFREPPRSFELHF